ncbi:twinfilin-1 isoform X2 [Hydra vulgaris]|uniref:Twinfilin-1 isoform X2 n=1 Tax=Hydra vulgaris TaxID=6087 RepID=A0ABM4DJ35_HYDVU
MSHQTGIQASEDLKLFFATVKDGNVRALKVGIENEQLVLLDHKSVKGTWDEDYDQCVLDMVEPKQPCYIFYRLDSMNNQGYEWLFISYSPDDSHTRQKMMYAGTRTTIKLEFGGGHILDEMFTTLKSEVCLAGYWKHKEAQHASAPLTLAETELKEVKQQHLDAAVSTKASTLPGISFPISEAAIEELVRIAKKEISYVQLSIDVKNEIINLEKAYDIETRGLAREIPNDHPRYHFFLFKHTHEGDYLETIVFIYSMPGYSCSVKERMLYSSCKATLLSGCEDILKMEIGKKLEISEGSELTEDFLQEELHPQKNVHKQKFAKPKPPAAKGGRRINNASNPSDE